MRSRGFARLSLAALLWNVFVIVWGAWVRVSRSGAGCGDHWPRCNGELIPSSPTVQTLIEFTHRATSGVALALVAGVFVWAFRAWPKGHAVRLGAALSMLFILTEALFGAALVLLRLVAGNVSTTRGWVQAAHLGNTFVLLGCLTLTWWWGRGRPGPSLEGKRRPVALAMGLALVVTLLVGMTGGIAALGDTLFPVRSVSEGLAQDFDPASHPLVRLRLWHPVFAVVGSLLAVGVAWGARAATRRRALTLPATLLTVVVLAQLALGVMNIALLTPAWLQLSHLFVADLLWVTLVLVAAEALALTPAGSP